MQVGLSGVEDLLQGTLSNLHLWAPNLQKLIAKNAIITEPTYLVHPELKVFDIKYSTLIFGNIKIKCEKLETLNISGT